MKALGPFILTFSHIFVYKRQPAVQDGSVMRIPNPELTVPTATVKVISIWSKMTGLDAVLRKRTENREYTVAVPCGDTPVRTLAHRAVLKAGGQAIGRHIVIEPEKEDDWIDRLMGNDKPRGKNEYAWQRAHYESRERGRL